MRVPPLTAVGDFWISFAADLFQDFILFTRKTRFILIFYQSAPFETAILFLEEVKEEESVES